MANVIDIVIPDLGDFSDVEIIELLVKPGDKVAQEDGLITLETEKATMDIPAPKNGVVEEISVAVGDTVSAGDVIGRLSVEISDTVVVTPAVEAELGQGETTVVATSANIGSQKLLVPDLGDFSDVDVIEVHVTAGSKVDIDDPLVTLETDKAAMDVPSTAAGTIESVTVRVGDKVSEGSEIAVIDAVAGAFKKPKEAPAVAPKAAPAQPAAAAPAKPAPAAPKSLPAIDEAGFSSAHASPSVRKLARELGVDLVQVKGTGLKDRILHDDVKAFVKAILTGAEAPPTAGPALPQVPVIDFAKFGEIESKPLTRIQKISGPRLQASWINLPHVTQHDLADKDGRS
jgi:pyruvate dehydrogenase E2 component (dihydrolipoamide acetyltransferase)